MTPIHVKIYQINGRSFGMMPITHWSQLNLEMGAICAIIMSMFYELRPILTHQ